MSNFKEIYPQINFREDLHRMDSLGEDDYEVWAYNGDPDFAPLSADYSYELVRNVKTVSGKNISITDGINMPIESFKLYGESSQSSAPSISNPVNFTSVGSWNTSTNYYDIKCYDNENISQLIYSSQPLSSLQNGVKDYYDNGWLYLSTIYDIFRATDNWEVEGALTNNNVLVVSLYRPNAKKVSTDIWCTHFQASENLSEPNRIKIDSQRIYISLDKASYPDLDTVLRWMRDNTVKICYQRKNTLKVASLPSVLLHTFEGTTNITNDQNAEMEVEYRIAPNARVWQRLEDGTFEELTS